MHNGTYRFLWQMSLVEHLGFPVQVSVDLPCHFRFFFVRNGGSVYRYIVQLSGQTHFKMRCARLQWKLYA